MRQLALRIAFAAAVAVGMILAPPPKPAQADCGISVVKRASYTYCEYDDGYGPVQYSGTCANGDDWVGQVRLKSKCWWDETGFVTATAYDPKFGNDMSVASRPPFVQFRGTRTQTVEVRLQDIYLYSTPDVGSIAMTVHIQVTPVSSHAATIVNDWVPTVQWQTEIISPPPGCDANGCG